MAGLFDKTRTHGNNPLQNSVEDLVEENLVRAASILTCAQDVSGLIPVRKSTAPTKFRYRFSQSCQDKHARISMFVIVTDKIFTNNEIHFQCKNVYLAERTYDIPVTN